MTKAEVLKYLYDQGYNVLPMCFFSVNDWMIKKEELIPMINSMPKPCIVRSSAFDEDKLGASSAGKYTSIGPTSYVLEAIDSVSDELQNSDQILIQPFIYAEWFGVVFTHDINDGSPYYTITYGEKNDCVTSGKTDEIKTFICYRSHSPDEPMIRNLINVVKSVESLMGNYLDIEFAIKNNCIYILQVRPIVKKITPNIDAYINSINFNERLLSCMSDWNPAEMIGINPRPLAYSLYETLITKTSWSVCRKELGYTPVVGNLMTKIAGKPYIDIKLSMMSLIPEDFSDKEELLEFYVSKLKAKPHLHDKIEFDVVYSCYDFDLEKRMEFCKKQSLVISLKKLTNQIIKNKTWIKYMYMLNNAVFTNTEDVISAGAIPFGGIARISFIAMSLLKSLERIGVNCDGFMKSLPSITKMMANDLSEGKESFLKKYGHLRPGTYDILSDNYKNGYDRYFQNITVTSAASIGFVQPDLTELLHQHEIECSSEDFWIFLRDAIHGRELGKFIYSKGVGMILESVEATNIDKYDLSFCELHQNLLCIESIEKNKKEYDLSRLVKLPQVIINNNDKYFFQLMKSEPNFITTKRVVGKFLFFENADPGHDWVFAQKIDGLITMYGGPNSHMAIRCAELDIPAIIGCGEEKYNIWKNAKFLEVDCANQTVSSIQ